MKPYGLLSFIQKWLAPDVNVPINWITGGVERLVERERARNNKMISAIMHGRTVTQTGTGIVTIDLSEPDGLNLTDC